MKQFLDTVLDAKRGQTLNLLASHGKKKTVEDNFSSDRFAMPPRLPGGRRFEDFRIPRSSAAG